MKTLFLILISSVCFAQCPKYGEYKTRHDSTQNCLKNRDIPSGLVPMEIPYQRLIHDINIDVSKFVVLRNVYIVKIKQSGGEECNCHSTQKNQLDHHILVSDYLDSLDVSHVLIVETTRFSQVPNLSIYLGKKVNIYGFLFQDDEHKNAAYYQVKKSCPHCWRAGITEIHPVTKIELSN